MKKTSLVSRSATSKSVHYVHENVGHGQIGYKHISHRLHRFISTHNKNNKTIANQAHKEYNRIEADDYRLRDNRMLFIDKYERLVCRHVH